MKERRARRTVARRSVGRDSSFISPTRPKSMPRARRASRARRERVIIVGGGAAGCAAAFALARARRDDDDDVVVDDAVVFDVELLERETRLGGVATTEFVGERVVINDGVQGGAVSYANVARLMRECDVEEPRRVDVRVSFGRGTTHWRNHGPPTALVEELREDIERFAKTLRAIERFEALYAFVSVERALRWHGTCLRKGGKGHSCCCVPVNGVPRVGVGPSGVNRAVVRRWLRR